MESLRALHGGGRPWIYWLALTGVIVGLGSLPFVEVDVSVSAPGIVRPATERVELRLPLSGRIARVLAQDNERVTLNQPLLELATPDLDERLARNAALQAEKRALLTLLDDLSAARLTEPNVLQMLDVGRAVESFAGLRALRQETTQLRVQIEAGRVAEAKARTELGRATALAEKGIATQRELDDARYALERVQAESRLTVEQVRTRWHGRREDEGVALDNLISEAKRLEAERALAIVRAPVAGAIQGLVGVSTGAFVNAAQPIANISPDDRLRVETLVSARDIGLVRVGQTVRLQVDAFPYTQWGLLEGRVAGVAADASSASSGSPPVFKVTIEPARPHLTLANGAVGALGKGMTVSARFITTRRTLLQILYQDASEWLDPQNHAATGPRS
ncbi:MAG: HlyD family efflux transporter periplasmic adaptor subunit [Candidatus Didemnitutus sp.]|nr:HlyD family efflux transporter periplasmic adaptor subunit [Candidatus Didemnitutus sp.]